MARKVMPGCAEEGAMLEKARLKKKQENKQYTQGYTASLVGKGQYIQSQWHNGQTRIIDSDWIRLSNELDFNPFVTRQYLLELAAQIHLAEQRILYKIFKRQKLL